MGKIASFFKAFGRGVKIGAAWLNNALTDFRIAVLSLAVAILYLVFTCVGVVSQNKLMIIITGVAASLYFVCIVFLALERPSLFGGLIARLGFTLSGGNWSAKDKKWMRGLWFLAVAPLFFTFWLAMFPSKTTGFIVIITASSLLLLFLIGHWQKIPSAFWKNYYRGFGRMFPIVLILFFAIYLPFSAFWKSAGKFAVAKSEQAGAWLISPSKAAEGKTEKLKNGKTKMVSPSRMVAQNKPPSLENKAAKIVSVFQPRHRPGLRRAMAASADNDELARAAEAGLPAFDQMRRELVELHAPKPMQKKSRPVSSFKMPKWAE